MSTRPLPARPLLLLAAAVTVSAVSAAWPLPIPARVAIGSGAIALVCALALAGPALTGRVRRRRRARAASLHVAQLMAGVVLVAFGGTLVLLAAGERVTAVASAVIGAGATLLPSGLAGRRAAAADPAPSPLPEPAVEHVAPGGVWTQ